MIKRLYKYFFLGLITILPLAVTIYLLFALLTWTEELALVVVRPLVGHFYIPGMGLLMGVLGIIAVGFMVSKQQLRKVVSYIELPFTSIPVIKSVYSSLKSFADYFSPGSRTTGEQVVILRIPGQALELVGLVTRKGGSGLPEGFMPGNRVAVYLPMGYMIGGYTVFVPSEWITPIAMSVEEAMRSSLIAWMSVAPSAQASTNAHPEAPPMPTPDETTSKPAS